VEKKESRRVSGGGNSDYNAGSDEYQELNDNDFDDEDEDEIRKPPKKVIENKRSSEEA
jgi:hypothetical protein